MADLLNIRRRIKGIKNMRQITSAMERVASVKMQRAILKTQNGRSFAFYSWDLLSRLSQIVSPTLHPFLQKREIKKLGLVVMASDRGLCGSYNTDILRATLAFLQNNPAKTIEAITVGKKAQRIILKVKNARINLLASFENFARDLEFSDTTALSKLVIEGFLAKSFDQVIFIYSHFISTLKHEITIRTLVPIEPEDLAKTASQLEPEPSLVEFKFEPSAKELMDKLLPHILRLQIYQMILEANASEHSARMVAMKAATDNAKDLIDDLQLTYNSVRQETITSEIAEIVGGLAAVES